MVKNADGFYNGASLNREGLDAGGAMREGESLKQEVARFIGLVYSWLPRSAPSCPILEPLLSGGLTRWLTLIGADSRSGH